MRVESIQTFSFPAGDSGHDWNPGTAKRGDPLPLHQRIRIVHRDDHTPHARPNNSRYAGGSALFQMTAGFKGDVERCVARSFTRLLQCQDLGVREAGTAMKSLADDAVSMHHEGTDHWIGTGCPPALRRQTKSQAHVVEVFFAVRHRFLRATRDRRAVRVDFVDFARDAEEDLAAFCASAPANAP